MGTFLEDERFKNAAVWEFMYRYFPTIQEGCDINRHENVMMLDAVLHQEFSRFSFILEATDVPSRYRTKSFPNFVYSGYRYIIPEFVTILSHDGRYPAPSKRLLDVHAAIGNILHATGRAEVIAKMINELRGSGGQALAKDGSTNVEEMLSVSALFLLAMNQVAVEGG
jgi:hypothetical protein